MLIYQATKHIISNKTYQPKITANSPFSLSSNTLSINTSQLSTSLSLWAYLASSIAALAYQPIWSVSSPLSSSNTIISADLGSYYSKTQIGTAVSSLLNKCVTITNDNGSNNPFTVDSSTNTYLFIVDPKWKYYSFWNFITNMYLYYWIWRLTNKKWCNCASIYNTSGSNKWLSTGTTTGQGITTTNASTSAIPSTIKR